MRIISTGAAAALLLASVCGAFAAPSAQGTKADSSVIAVQQQQQNASPQDKTMNPSEATKPTRRKSSAHRYRGHKSSLHRTSSRYRSAKTSPKRAGTKAMKSARKTTTRS